MILLSHNFPVTLFFQRQIKLRNLCCLYPLVEILYRYRHVHLFSILCEDWIYQLREHIVTVNRFKHIPRDIVGKFLFCCGRVQLEKCFQELCHLRNCVPPCPASIIIEYGIRCLLTYCSILQYVFLLRHVPVSFSVILSEPSYLERQTRSSECELSEFPATPVSLHTSVLLSVGALPELYLPGFSLFSGFGL